MLNAVRLKQPISLVNFSLCTGLDSSLLIEKLSYAKDDALVMHPGPMNRGVEIASEIADGPQSVIEQQVEMGVAVRMAVMQTLMQADGRI